MIRTFLCMAALFMIFFLLVNNKDTAIPIQYYPGGIAKPVPLYLLILGTFLLGFILSVIMMFPSWFKLKLESRRQRREIESLAEEIGHLRVLAPSSPSSLPPLPLEKNSPEV